MGTAEIWYEETMQRYEDDLYHQYAQAALTGLLAGRSGTVDAARMAKYVRTAKAIAREMLRED